MGRLQKCIQLARSEQRQAHSSTREQPIPKSPAHSASALNPSDENAPPPDNENAPPPDDENAASIIDENTSPAAAAVDGPADKEALEAAKKRARRAKRKAQKREQQRTTSNTDQNNANSPDENDPTDFITIETYKDETQIGLIMEMIGKELSEPYSIYTYRYFLNTWPELTLLAYDTRDNKYIGVVVCKIDGGNENPKPATETTTSTENTKKGYIAMLAVDETKRRLGIGSRLVQEVTDKMHDMGCEEVILETEVTNTKALNLYSRLGFIREKRLFRYYLNGVDAFRLVRYRPC